MGVRYWGPIATVPTTGGQVQHLDLGQGCGCLFTHSVVIRNHMGCSGHAGLCSVSTQKDLVLFRDRQMQGHLQENGVKVPESSVTWRLLGKP